MIESVDDIKRILSTMCNGSVKYNQLMTLLNAGIPLTGFQANLLFLRRGYGKTHMSYCTAYLRLLDDGALDVTHSARFDSDCRSRRSVIQWVHGFKAFLGEHHNGDLLYTRVGENTIVQLINQNPEA